MREDSIVHGHGSGQNRHVLGNLTNRPLKRHLSSILGDSGFKSGVDYAKKQRTLEDVDGDSVFPEHVHIKAANFVKEKCVRSCGTQCYTFALSRFNKEQESDRSLSSSEADTALSNAPKETLPTQFDLLSDEVHLVQEGKQIITVGDDASGDCLANSLVPTCSGPGSNKKDCFGMQLQSNAANEGAIDHNLMNDDKVSGVGEPGIGNHGSTVRSKLSGSEGSKPLGLERCSGPKSENCANLNASDDVLKTCSCSFCLKASYIWADLHYQDIKGRISALNKSQKDASILAQKSKKEKEVHHDEGNSSKSKLEFDLSGQWTSLFCHMEEMFAQECSQLQNKFVALKDLREECKTNLEMLNGMPTEKQQ